MGFVNTGFANDDDVHISSDDDEYNNPILQNYQPKRNNPHNYYSGTGTYHR